MPVRFLGHTTSGMYPCSSRSIKATAMAVSVLPRPTTSPNMVPRLVMSRRASVRTAVAWYSSS